MKSTYRWMVQGEDKEAPIRWLEDTCTGDERWRDERQRVERKGDERWLHERWWDEGGRDERSGDGRRGTSVFGTSNMLLAAAVREATVGYAVV